MNYCQFVDVVRLKKKYEPALVEDTECEIRTLSLEAR